MSAPPPRILIVDDQRDIIRLIHSTLDTLGHKFEIYEAPSGEEALLEASRTQIDLLIVDYRLPGMTGVELMKRIRAKNETFKTIIITGMTDRGARDEMLSAGAVAIFDKPIPLGDFLDAVERSLGLRRTILPPEDSTTPGQHKTLANLLASYRQDMGAEAIFLISDRGRVVVRAGDLPDSSMEVSLMSALAGIYNTSWKIARFIQQDTAAGLHVFRGAGQDYLMVPVNTAHALLAVGPGLADRDRLLEVTDTLLILQGDVKKVLKDMGVATQTLESVMRQRAADAAEPKPSAEPTPEPVADELAELLAKKKKMKTDELNEFWEEIIETHGPVPVDPGKLTYEQASKLGLAPDIEAGGKKKK